METTTPIIWPATSALTAADRWQHLLARLGYRRHERRVEPGLYALGRPGPDSPVLVTANYRLSFDALRTALPGAAAYILVLDTDGVNVWCSAGKGTFGADELVRRIEATGLAQVVRHRRLILPQLAAAGVAAHEVSRRSGFRVEYGPVRAADLPAYLNAGAATPEMRRVRFDLGDRLLVAPVEVVHGLLPMLGAAALLYLVHGRLAALAVIMSFLAGTVLFPALLPWLPMRDFTSKGFILGGAVALVFALAEVLGGGRWRLGWALSYLLALPAVTAYLALNFTGSTTFTSRTGVRREIYAYVPAMAALFGAGLLLAVGLTVAQLI